MQLLDYQLSQNEDGTYLCTYTYLNEKGEKIKIEIPRVQLNYEMPTLINREDIIFPNIKGHCILS